MCFDWVRPRQYVVHVLITEAKDLGIPTLALPHGVFIYTNDFITIESRPLQTHDKLNQYDHVIVQNKLYQDVMSRDFSEDTGDLFILKVESDRYAVPDGRTYIC